MLFQSGDRVSAATSLRRGFVDNGYIAEILSGMANPLAIGIWHGSNFERPELACEYASRYDDLWSRTPDAIAFLRWLHTHPKILAERAAILQWKEALLWESDFERRGLILEQEAAALARIDDRLSAELVVDQKDRQGRAVSPWLHSLPSGDLFRTL